MNPLDILRQAGLSTSHPVSLLNDGVGGKVFRVGRYAIKLMENPPLGFFPTEARGLYALSQAGFRTPEIIWASEDGLILEHLEPTEPDWERFARDLAKLHRLRAPTYGWDAQVFLGSFELPTGTSENWTKYFFTQKIEPFLEKTQTLLAERRQTIEGLFKQELPTEGPSVIHGDLWRGNLMFSDGPVLIDPSSWWGERAVDLAQMELFGGFPPIFWRIYRTLYPVPPQVEAAIPKYQLLYALAHVYFFKDKELPFLDQVISRCIQNP